MTIFLNGMNESYKEIGLDNYFPETEQFYKKAIDDINSVLPMQDYDAVLKSIEELGRK